ncbi:MAG TPA: hypothetical protein VN577_18220 [Terriglobales bacterium]|nr:hypothetical protein [Terriglobales bacterium]
MSRARQIANRWYGKVAGVALIALAIAVTSVPAPTGVLHGVEDRAISTMAPMMAKTAVGKQLLDMYAAREAQCHGVI